MDCQDEPREVHGQNGPSFLAQVCQTNRAGKTALCPAVCHDLLRSDIQFVGFCADGYKAPGAARLGARDRQGQLQVPQYLPRQGGPLLTALSVEPAGEAP